MDKYSIDCTGDVVTGDEIQFVEAVFSGSFRRPKFSHEHTLTARVIRDSYGRDKQQHTFTLEVIACDDAAYSTGDIVTRKGRNIYRNGTRRALWPDESMRHTATNEKHRRGDRARAEREQRISERF